MEQTYKDHTIKVTGEWRFLVTGPLFDAEAAASGVNTYDSLFDAKGMIDERIAAANAQKRAELDFRVSALDASGKPCIVRGVHAGQGHLLIVHGSPASSVDSPFVYPVHPVLRETLEKLAGLQAEVATLIKIVMPYRVNAKRAYGRTRPENYEPLLKKFADELAEKTALASKL